MTTIAQSPDIDAAETEIAPPHIAPMQLRVCRLIVNGYTARQTAGLLGMTEETVKHHLKATRARLVVHGWDVSNTIRLRRALRTLGHLDGVELL